MKLKETILLTGTIFAIDLIIYSIPDSFAYFALSGVAFFSGEFYRLVTFLFVHLNSLHLTENLVALIVASALAYEFDLSGKDYIISFAATALIVALPSVYLYPTILIGGSSLGIYAVFGALTVKGGDFMPRRFLVPIFGFSIFYNFVKDLILEPALVTKEMIYQTLFHFSGFMTGAILFYLLLHITYTRKMRKKHDIAA